MFTINKLNLLKHKSPGFSLIELLVSITLLSIIFVVVISTLWSGLKVKKRSREIAQKYMGARIFLHTLGVRLSSAFEFDFPGYKNFKWEVINDPSNPIKKKLSIWELYCDEMKLKIVGKPPILRTTYYVKEEQDNGEKKRVIYRKMKPVYPRTNSGIRTIEGPMIEGDIDLEVEYPTRRDPQTTTPKKVTIYFKMKEKQEDGTIEYKRELTRDVYFPRYKKKEQR